MELGTYLGGEGKLFQRILLESLLTSSDLCSEINFLLFLNIFKKLGERHNFIQRLIRSVAESGGESSTEAMFLGSPSIHKNICYIHNNLIEKARAPVTHRPRSYALPGPGGAPGYEVVLDTDSVKIPRPRGEAPLVKHSEMVALAQKLYDEVRQNPHAKREFMAMGISWDVNRLRKKASNAFFKDLLDDESAQNPPAHVSSLSLKLRKVIVAAREGGPSLGPGLSPASKLMLQLLINVMRCHGNKQDGIDHTSRALDERPIYSDGERYKDEVRLSFLEEMRQMREEALNGEGPFIRRLLFPEGGVDRIEEPPHQRIYMTGMLGHELGLFMEGDDHIPIDLNNMAVGVKLQECSKQQALDILYDRFFTTEKVFNHYDNKFNKDQATVAQWTRLMYIVLGGEAGLRDPRYCQLNEYSVPTRWTKLAVAKALTELSLMKWKASALIPSGFDLTPEQARAYVGAFEDLRKAQRRSGKSVEDFGRSHWAKHGHKEQPRLVKLRQMGFKLPLSDQDARAYVGAFEDLRKAQLQSGKSVEDFGRFHWAKHGHKEQARLVKLRQMGFKLPLSDQDARAYVGAFEDLRKAQRRSGKSVEDFGRYHWANYGHKEKARLVKLRQIGYDFGS